MFTTVTSDNPFIYTNSIGGGAPFVDTSRPFAGSLRYQYGSIEVFTGSCWSPITSGNTVSIGLSSEMLDILNWAKSKMESERRANELAKTNVTVASALEAVRVAEEQLKITTILCE